MNQTMSVPFANPSFSSPYAFTDWAANGFIEWRDNVSKATSTYGGTYWGWIGPRAVIPLSNTSEAATHGSYGFFVNGFQAAPDIFQTVNNVTYTYSMNVSLVGLSRPVYINTVVNFTNTNVPSQPVTKMNSSSPNNHAAHAAGMDSGSFQGSTHSVKNSTGFYASNSINLPTEFYYEYPFTAEWITEEPASGSVDNYFVIPEFNSVTFQSVQSGNTSGMNQPFLYMFGPILNEKVTVEWNSETFDQGLTPGTTNSIDFTVSYSQWSP